MSIAVVPIHILGLEKNGYQAELGKNVSDSSAISAGHLYFKRNSEKLDITQIRKP